MPVTNYIKMSFGRVDEMFFFDSRIPDQVRTAYGNALARKIEYDASLIEAQGKFVHDGKARLSIWRRCFDAPPGLPEVGEYTFFNPTPHHVIQA